MYRKLGTKGVDICRADMLLDLGTLYKGLITYFHVLISGPRVILEGLSFGSICSARSKNFRRIALSIKPPPNFILLMNCIANFARCLGSNRPNKVLALSSLSGREALGVLPFLPSMGESALIPVLSLKLSEEAFSYIFSSRQDFLKYIAPSWNISHSARPYAHISHLGRSSGSIGDRP
jgi:hypothetical protein